LKNENILEGSVEYNRRIDQVENETVNHLFWMCRESQRVISGVINELAGTDNRIVSKNKYFEGLLLPRKCDSNITILVVRTIQFGLYNCRFRKRIPLKAHIMEDVECLKAVLGKSVRWREGLNNLRELCLTMLEGD
jgi:hypothetical protein